MIPSPKSFRNSCTSVPVLLTQSNPKNPPPGNAYFWQIKKICTGFYPQKISTGFLVLPSSSPLQPFSPMHAPGFLKKNPFFYACCQSHFSKRNHLAEKENPTSFSPFFPFFLFFPSCSRSPYGRSICAVPLKIKSPLFKILLIFPPNKWRSVSSCPKNK